ncbi:MAG TPA: AgmX/PglI C-terminal domain-containing protein [Sandaracinaceae bacterium LLY-WYZ-13_1]|nr:AgmX/PglI C-terminal domain-containing protein [Sandaracinaceae bacterium LLY-WYZ-13_1]
MSTRSLVVGPFLLALACGSEPEAPPRDPVAEGWRAAQAGDHESSAAAFGEATESHPEDQAAWLGLAREELRAGDPVEARAAAERAVALDDASADAHELLGLARLRDEAPAEAATELARALELDADRDRVRFPLARARERAGQLEEAVAAYRAAAEAGAQPSRALAAAARVRLDALGDEAPEEDVVRAIEGLLDRAEERAGDDEAALGAIVAQRRRLERVRARGADEAREVAQSSGVIGILQALGEPGEPSSSIFGQDSALGDSAALGGLMGERIDEEDLGFGGLGRRGVGGSGGTGEGRILGTLGRVGRGGSGSGSGAGYGGLRGRSAAVPRVRIGSVTVVGDLPREVVRRVVRRRINHVRYCYEQQLARDPDLAGDVSLALLVSPEGAVSTARIASSTLGNTSAEGCIARAGRRLRFPAPDGGGVVQVTVPYSLSSTR